VITPMTKGEQGELIEYARRFGFSVGNRYPRFTDEVVSASLLGATIAFESPDFPEDIEGRRKFLGQTCWNMMRRELTQCIQKKQPILFTDLGESGEGQPYTVVDPHDYEAESDWADEFEFLASQFLGMTREVFVRAYGPVRMTQPEIGREVGRSVPTLQYHIKKIERSVRERHERMEASA
jgi:hypothetical protein